MLGWTGALFAQAGRAWPFGMGWGEIAIAVVIIAAVIAIVYIALRQFGVTPPPWFIQVLWVLAVAFICVLAIRILLSL
jgi:hypothetical protein